MLLESDNHECPSCKTSDVSPDSLVPVRFLRLSVAKFKNENLTNKLSSETQDSKKDESSNAHIIKEKSVDNIENTETKQSDSEDHLIEENKSDCDDKDPELELKNDDLDNASKVESIEINKVSKQPTEAKFEDENEMNGNQRYILCIMICVPHLNIYV